jgi:hypothetical protein
MTSISTPLTPRAIFVRSGLTALLYLSGGVPLVFALAFALSQLPGHMDLFESPLLGLGLFIAVSAGGGWLWGRRLERLIGQLRSGPLAWAVAISFPVISMAAAMALGRLEVFLLEEGGAGDTPIYVVFAVLFTLSSFFVVAAMGSVIGLALQDRRLALELALSGGLAGGAGFLLADVVQHLLGRVVGGPNAAQTATMLTVMALGHAIAAFTGGGVIGGRLARHTAKAGR